MTHDAIVVGGGFAGLIAARDLAEKGRDVVVLEGGNRFGGRVYYRSLQSDPTVMVEVGGTYVDPRFHRCVYEEIRRYGIAMEVSAGATSYRHALGGQFIERGLPIPVEEALEAERALFEILTAAHRIKLGLGLDTQNLEDLDVPVEEFLAAFNLPPVTKDLLRSWAWNMMGMPPHEASALWILQFVAAHNYSPLGVAFSLNEVFADGTASLIDALVTEIPQVRLNSTVVEIEQKKGQVSIALQDGERLDAATVVLATPLNTWQDIRFSPDLTGVRREIVDETQGCRGVKLLILAENVPEGVYGAGFGGSLATIYEYKTLGKRRLLTSFTDIDSVAPTDRAAVEQGLRQFVPEAKVVAVDAHDWNQDPLFKAGWMSPRVGQISRGHSKLSERNGRLLFAGSDISMKWPSYIEGAIETGTRAAVEVEELLGPP